MSFLGSTLNAVTALGAEVAAGRRQVGWTQLELAQRLGVSRKLVSRIESGNPGVSVGVAFEAAVLVGVPLFGVESRDLDLVSDRAVARAALLPHRIRSAPVEIENNF